MIKVFLDDLRHPPDTSWICIRTYSQVIELLDKEVVEILSLDHDLGNDQKHTGYDVLKWIEEMVALKKIVPPKIYVHSQNPVGVANMALAIRSIDRLHIKNINQLYIDKTIKFAQEQYKKYGDNIRTVWDRKETQIIAFQDLIKVGDLEQKSILDVGCGFGDLYEFLTNNNISVQRYLGIDVVPEFINTARKKYPFGTFELRNLYEKPLGDQLFDYVIASGIFSLPLDEWNIHFTSTLNELLNHSRLGTAFNMLISKRQIKYPLLYVIREELEEVLQNLEPEYIYNESINLLTILIKKRGTKC